MSLKIKNQKKSEKITTTEEKDIHIPGDWKSNLLLLAVNVAVVFFIAYLSLIIPESKEIIGSILFWAATIILFVLFIVFIPLSIRYFHMINDMVTTMKNNIDDIKNRHITMVVFTKEIIISKDLFNEGNYTKLHHKMKIYNHQKESYYDNYHYYLESSEDVSEYDSYKFWVNEVPTKIERENFRYYSKQVDAPSSSDAVLKGCEIDIHVGIPGKSTGTLEILEERCPCFSDLKKAEAEGVAVDSLGLMVYHPTDVLKIVVRLDDDLKGYSLGTGARCPDRSLTGSSSFKVIDKSSQRIEQYEIKLREWGAVPEYSRDGRKIIWEVHNPKVGYRYHLPFSLIKDEMNKGIE